MPVFKEIYHEVASNLGKIINAFYEKYKEFEEDDLITFNDCYSKDSSNYEIAVSNNKGGIIRELMFTVLGNRKLFDKFISFFEEYYNKQLTGKEYLFKIQKQSLSVAKINVIINRKVRRNNDGLL